MIVTEHLVAFQNLYNKLSRTLYNTITAGVLVSKKELEGILSTTRARALGARRFSVKRSRQQEMVHPNML